MNQRDKMQKIVEAAGECWHDRVKEDDGHCSWIRCITCGSEDPDLTPPPTDLNELFRLAEKCGFAVKLYTDVRHHVGSREHECKVMHVRTGTSGWKLGNTPAEALLNALYESVKEQTP